MDKWTKREENPCIAQCILKDYEDLGHVIATTVFEKENKVLYVFKTIENKSFLFLVKNEGKWEALSCIPEEVIDNMIGAIEFNGVIY